MLFYSIIIISSLFGCNTRAADNCLNVKDISDRYAVNNYNNSYYNDTDKNVYYSFNVSTRDAPSWSYIAIKYKKSNLFGYDGILVIVFADCPLKNRYKCGMYDVGLYVGQFRNDIEVENQIRIDPKKNLEYEKYYSIEKSEIILIFRYLTRMRDEIYRGTYNVYILPTAKNESVLENHKGHYCRHKMKFDLYVPLGNYSVMQHTKYYNDELKKCDCTSEEYYGKQKDDKDKSASPVIPVVIGVVVAVVVIGVVVVVAVLYHRGMLGNIVNQHRTSGVPA